MYQAKDLTGKRFGRWLVLGRASNKSERVYWNCLCDCGTKREVLGQNLTNGRSVSCGCENREKAAERMRSRPNAHRQSQTRLYRAWRHMIWRCEDVHDKNYSSYGGRGITVCPEWKDFLTFKAWADKSGYAENLELDRIDNDKGYCPDNCRWSTRLVQVRNRRTTRFVTIGNETKSVQEWCQIFGYSYGVGRARLYRGIPLDRPYKPTKKTGHG